MKDPWNRTKVVIRHLPPSISKSVLIEQIDARFFGRYNWLSFRPGKISQKNQRHSQAYINFQSPEDVVEFAEFFDGHIFVNEKGYQFKALVEYSPSQSVPKLSSKKDGREGTIFKDPEYAQFVEFIAKHGNLPSAEIQLERREAERAGGPKETIIVTPLMDFVRQKRATKSGSQRSSANGKLSRKRAGGAVSSSSSSSKRGTEKQRGPTSVYAIRDSAKTSRSGMDKSTYMLVSRKEDQQSVLASRTEISEAGAVVESNGTMPVALGCVEIEKRRLVLLKGKERDASHMSSGSTQQNTTASVRNITGSISSKQSQQHDVSGRFIRSIRSKRDVTTGPQHEQLTQDASSERDKRPPRPPKPRLTAFSSVPYNDGKRFLDDKAAVNYQHGSTVIGDKNEKCMRNKDTPHYSDEIRLSDDTCLSAPQLSESLEGISLSQHTVGQNGGYNDIGLSSIGGCGSKSRTGNDAQLSHREIQFDLRDSKRNTENRSGCPNASTQNGTHRTVGHRGSFSEGKLLKRGASTGYGTHERRVWVQKLGSGT